MGEQSKKRIIMDEIFRDFLVSVSAFAAIFGIIYIYYITRHRERMYVLEKGVETPEFLTKKNNQWSTLKYGILLIGIAIGILIGNVLYNHLGLGSFISYLSMVFLFGGLSLISYFLIEKKYKK